MVDLLLALLVIAGLYFAVSTAVKYKKTGELPWNKGSKETDPNENQV